MCGCCCSNIDFEFASRSYDRHDENDIYSFSELDGEELKITYYYDFRNDKILKKNDKGKYERINFIKTRHSDKCEVYETTFALLTSKSGKILIYWHYTLKNKLKEAYHQNIRNKVREEVRKELSADEPLLSL